MTEHTNDLAAALAKAQSEMGHAHKDGRNPHYKSTYATLSSVWDACREPLTKHGLSIIQRGVIENNQLLLETKLLHVSGQSESSLLPVNPTKNDPQGMGSALTYARRYGLMAMVGIAPDDDDGQAASQPTKAAQAAPKPGQANPKQIEQFLDRAYGKKAILTAHDPDEFAIVLTSLDVESLSQITELAKMEQVLTALDERIAAHQTAAQQEEDETVPF